MAGKRPKIRLISLCFELNRYKNRRMSKIAHPSVFFTMSALCIEFLSQILDNIDTFATFVCDVCPVFSCHLFFWKEVAAHAHTVDASFEPC